MVMAVSNVPDPYASTTVVNQFLTTTLLKINFKGTTAPSSNPRTPSPQRKNTENRSRDKRRSSEARSRMPGPRRLGGNSAPTPSKYGTATGLAPVVANGAQASRHLRQPGTTTPRTGLCPFHLAGLLKITLESGKTFECEPEKNGDCGRKHAGSLKSVTRGGGGARSILAGGPHRGLSMVADKAVGEAPRGTFQDE